MPYPLSRFIILVLFSVLLLPAATRAQKILACTADGHFISIDVADSNCQYNYVNVNHTGSTPYDIPFSNALYKDTLYYNTTSGGIYRYVLGSTEPAVLLTNEALSITLTVDKNGILYYVGADRILVRYNPHTNITERLGYMIFTPAGDLVFFNDKLILAANEGLVEVNINKPEESTLYMETPGYFFFSLINVAVGCDQNTIYGIAPSMSGYGSDLIEIDMVNKKIVGKRCTLTVPIDDAGSITEAGGYAGVTINNVTSTTCISMSAVADIRVDAYTASADSLIYILNNTDSNYNGLFKYLPGGDYRITVKSRSGYKDDTTVHIVAAAQAAVQIQAENDNCNGNKGSLLIKNKNPSSAFSVSFNNNPYSSDLYYNHLDTGTYSIRVKNTNGCIMDSNVVIRYDHITPAVYLGKDTSLCFKQMVSLKAFVTYGDAAYLWQDGSTTPEYTVSKEGMYTLSVQIPCGTGKDSIYIDYKKGVKINNVTSTTCTSMSAIADLRVDAYTASTESVLYMLNNTDSNYNGVFSNLSSGNYNITVKNQSGCKDDTTLHIVAAPKVVVQIRTENDNCNANKGSIFMENKNTSSALLVSLNNNPYSSNLYYDRLDTGTYAVRLKNAGGCIVDTTVFIGYDHFTPGVYLGKDTTLCFKQTLLLKAPAYTGAAYLWQDGSTTPEYTVSKEGTYVLNLQTPCGTNSDAVHIKYQQCNCDFYIPGAFTPNHDGLNDQFTIHSKCLSTNFHLQVFNRTGQLVYQSHNINAGWDGDLNGLPQSAGAYIWRITYFDVLSSKTVSSAGTVVIIR